jgi:hypothetical protein
MVIKVGGPVQKTVVAGKRYITNKDWFYLFMSYRMFLFQSLHMVTSSESLLHFFALRRKLVKGTMKV